MCLAMTTSVGIACVSRVENRTITTILTKWKLDHRIYFTRFLDKDETMKQPNGKV
jgi:hypothetical protein